MRKLHLYYGTGKGKTTAAMGLAVRALGHGQRVLIAQFLKSGTSGELEAFRRLEGALVYPSVQVKGFLFQMTPEERAATCAEQTQMARELAAYILREQPQTIILDELAVAWQLGIVEEQAAIALVEAALSCGETITTGRDAPAWLHHHADYVSRIDAEKHPYNTEGLMAREGVEW